MKRLIQEQVSDIQGRACHWQDLILGPKTSELLNCEQEAFLFSLQKEEA